MRERTRLQGERGTFHYPRAPPTPSRPVLVIALHFVLFCRIRSLPARSLTSCENIFLPTKNWSSNSNILFLWTGANKQLIFFNWIVVRERYPTFEQLGAGIFEELKPNKLFAVGFFPLKIISCGFYGAWTRNRDEKDHDEERKIFSFLISYLLITSSAVSLQKSEPYCLRTAHLLLALWLVVNTFL